MKVIKMDFQSQTAPPIIPVMQSDAQSRFIGIALYNGGTPYKAPDGVTYSVQYRGNDQNNFGWYDTITADDTSRAAVIVDEEKPYILTIELAEQALRRPGELHVNLCAIAAGGYELRSFDIICHVNAAAYPDDVAVEAYIMLSNMPTAKWLAYVAACQDAQSQAKQARTDSQIAAATSEKNAAASAVSAEQAASSATAAKSSETRSRESENQAASYQQSTKEYFEQVRTITIGAQGWYPTLESLQAAVPVGENGWWAVLGTTDTIWIWDSDSAKWKDSSQSVDISDYLTQTQIKKMLEGYIPLRAATSSLLGGVKLSDDFTIDENGVLHLANKCPFAIGDVIQTINDINPAERWGGTWEEIAPDRVLMGASSSHAAGTTVDAGLPNITASKVLADSGCTGAIKNTSSWKDATQYGDGQYNLYAGAFNAANCSSVYGKSDTVQPAAYYVHIWLRTA